MSHPTHRSLALVPLLAIVVALALGTDAIGGKKRKIEKQLIEALPAEYQSWLEEVQLLITDEEIETFLKLAKDYQRDSFIDRFWRVRDPYPDTGRNEFKDKWDARVAEARRVAGSLDEERALVLLANGLPNALVDLRCSDLWPSQVWYYEKAESNRREVMILFVQTGSLGKFRLWDPTEGLRSLYKFPTGSPNNIQSLVSTCSPDSRDALLAVMRKVFSETELGYLNLVHSLVEPPKMPSGEWAITFNSYTTDVDEGAATFSAELSVDYPGRHKTRTVTQGIVSVESSELALSELGGHTAYNLAMTGEVLRDDKLFDSFRYSFNLPSKEIEADKVPLLFERYLRPGDYQLILRIQDINAGSFFRVERQLSVPRVETVLNRTPPDPETARILAEANAAIDSGETTLKIVPPRGELQTGMLRIDTLTSGSDIERVHFTLDGREVLKKRSPPFSVELDLGSLPRMRTLGAVAYDHDGEEVARDEVELNGGSHRFAIRLIEPRRDKTYTTSLRAGAIVEVPDGKAVERVEFFLNEDLVATLYQEPYSYPIVLPEAAQVAYVRAVAYQPDGNSTEDLVFVNAPEYLEELDVQFVELYIAVLNRQKRPVDDLAPADFSIFEDGVPQSSLRFEKVANLPIHAGILIDVSASMAENLESAQAAALRFFEHAMTPRDRATLITFNDHPNLIAKFTNDLQELAAGLSGLTAERGTALYDSLIFSLYYFNGIKGQRALIVLSDGRDEHSRFTFENTLEYARRAGVAIYTIGLDRGKRLGDARQKLNRLAAETGGRGFFIKEISELEPIYEEIQRELRSRYYLAYQSSNTDTSGDFRTIEVELARSDLEAKTLRGYYP
ncbi:MAG: VWA domain-containing protein [Acidobacteriota bacterium]|nr:VWA domain-containing protein [Acidobacteriota bacterium]